MRDVHDSDADYWIDFTDYDKMVASEGFDPAVSFGKYILGFLGDLFTHPDRIDPAVVLLRIPTSRDTFNKHIDEMWDYGKSRMIEALAHPHDKLHMRVVEKYNTSAKMIRNRDFNFRSGAQ